MSTSFVRGFSSAGRAAIRFGGAVTLDDITVYNAVSGQKLKEAVVNLAESMEEDVSISVRRTPNARAN